MASAVVGAAEEAEEAVVAEGGSKASAAKQRRTRSRFITAAALVLSLAVFTWFAYYASRQVVFDWEIALFDTIYHWPQWLYPFFLTITQLGNFLIIPVALAGALVHKRMKLGANILMTGGLTYVLLIVAKEIIARPRPALLFTGVGNRETIVYGYGFPSGHTAISVALALTVYMAIPKRYRWIAVAWIVLVPLSRIYLAAHVPTDIIGGYCVGIAAFCVVRLSDVISTPKHQKRA